MNEGNASFLPLRLINGKLFEHTDFEVYGLVGRQRMQLSDGTWMVYVHEGQLMADEWVIGERQYGCLTGYEVHSTKAKTRAMLVRFRWYHGLPMIGGPTEERGRLRYIDGCTDSLLVPPVKKGDPCLNLLHFPPATIQTPHTHPDHRIGFVAGGRGECVTPGGNFDLVEGMAFIIHPGSELSGDVGLHSFNTAMRTMTVIAWHPTSDVGPTDELHPMLAQTHIRPTA